MKQFIGFQDSQTAIWEIYKLRAEGENDGYYMRVDGSDNGFNVKKVCAYPHLFIFGDSQQDVKHQIAIKNHKITYGDGKRGDVACPNCGFRYTFDPYDYNDGYYAPGIDPNFLAKVNCICGKKLTVKIKNVEINWEIKEA